MAVAAPTYKVLEWSDLDGWAEDDHAEALAVFLETCPDLKDETWSSICALAGQQSASPRALFEALFRPVLIEDGTPTLFTGYFEPELIASRTRTERFRFPIYRFPSEIPLQGQWFTRAEIERGGLLENRDLEIAWLDDPVDRFFLQVQGSGRLKFTDGTTLRIGYGGSNGHEYRSVGVEMARRGILKPHQVSARAIRRWVNENPGAGADLLRHNPSYIFFREVNEVPADRGPIGAMNRSVTPMRSISRWRGSG